MTGFFFHHFWLNRSQNTGRRLRAMRLRLAKKRGAIRRMRESLSALRIAAEQIERDHELMFAAEQIDRRNVGMIAENALIDQLVHNLLAEIESDPFNRNVFEGIDALNLDERNQAQPPREGGRTDDRRE